ncbi:OsmC family protein [Agriterribacter sp.]|uniref:OsmC family protein n=1 Tax=Agriterribacter sp. TaxID=2821509 RepID=UPI002C7453A4|nr:OsmC family protein [Agriterribacter sp.]HRP58417.1 OsmC family protein [Agriterribacter sp.]
MNNKKIIASGEAENKGELYTTPVRSGEHAWVADELKSVGGRNAGPAPGDYLCIALASCKAITLRMYVQRKQWKVDVINVKANLVRGEVPGAPNTFYCEVNVNGDINEDQKKRLLQIAKACPVSRLLGKPNEVITVVG